MSRYLLRVIICLCLVSLGIVIGKFVNILPHFKVDETVNLVDVLSIIATLFLAWYVSKILDKEQQDSRGEKDLILKRIEDIYQLIDESHRKVIFTKVAYQEAASYCKRINLSLKTIFTVIECIEFSIDADLKGKLQANSKKLRDLLTNTPPLANPSQQLSTPPITVTGGILHLSENRVLEVENEYDNLKNNVLLLEISINKA